MKTDKLILSSGLTLAALAAAAFGHDHSRSPQSGQEVAGPPLMAVPARPADKNSIPAYLLASICGMPAKEGDAAFERRVQLARLLSDRAQIGADNKPPLFASLGEFTYSITTKQATGKATSTTAFG